MVALSSSQKKTAFAVILLALIAVGVMVSGRGGFSGLRSDAFNNPSFVCSEATQAADKDKYDRAGADIQKFSAEKAGLQTKIQGWNADIRKNEAQIKKLTKEETAAEKKERALEIAVKKQCTPRVLATCAAKKQELQDVRQEIKKIRSSLASEKTQNTKFRTNIQSAESNIKLLEKQIQEIQNFKADYETCKKALEKPIITSFSPEVGSVGTIITIYGSRFTSQSTVLIGDNVIDVTPTVVSPDGDWLKISFPRTALENFPADLYSLRVSNVGNVSVNSDLASNSVLFSIKNGEVGIAEFEVIAPGEVFVNEPFDMTVKALDASGKIYDKYEGNIFFDTNNNAADVVFPFENAEYGFNLADGGIHTFEKGVTIKKVGTYQLVVFELDSPNGGTEKMVQVVVKERANPVATCTNLTVSPTSVTNGGEVTYTCTGNNATSYLVKFLGQDGISIGTRSTSTGSMTIPATPTGPYGVGCFINGQTTTPESCIKTINNIQPSTPVDTFTVSLDGSTPLSRFLLDNASEHRLAVFRLSAPNTEDLDVDSIKIATADGTNGNDMVASYKFYNGATLLGTVTPDGDGNAELFLTDGALVIPANDYKLVTVKVILRDINGISFKNGDILLARIKSAGDIKTTGTTSGVLIKSNQTDIQGNIMKVYEAYPVVSFAPDTGGISTAINLGANQLIAKIAITNPGNKDVTFQSGDGNKFAVRIKTFGDDTNAGKEVVTLKDQDGTTLDTGTIKSGTGEDQIDFDMSLVNATIGTTIPAGQTKYFYIYADTSDLEDNGNQIQVWLDDTAADVTFGINGTGAYAVGDFVFRGDIFGPVLSRSF